MTSVSLFHHTDLMPIVGSYLSPRKANALFNLFFSRTDSFSLFLHAVQEHTYCDRDGMHFVRKECYEAEHNYSYLVVIKEKFPKLRELALSTFSEPGRFALELASDPLCAPIVYYSRYHLVHLKGEELRKVIDTLQNRPDLFKALKREGIRDKDKLKIALFQAIFQKCNSAQAEECFPWAVRGPTAISDERGCKMIIAQVNKINSEIVSQFHADSSQSQEDMTRSLSQKRPASPSASEPNPKRQRTKKGIK